MTGPIPLAGIAAKLTKEAFGARNAMHDVDQGPFSTQTKPQSHNAEQPKSINFQNALANLVSKAPQGITSQAPSQAAEARRNFGSLMAKPQAA